VSVNERLHAIDAVRAFALLLGVALHAGFSFIPGLPAGLWAVKDSSPSVVVATVVFVSHIFRMSLFFFVAGFFARLLFKRDGVRGFWSNRSRRILLPLVAGWIVVFPLITTVWIWGLTGRFGRLPAVSEITAGLSSGAFPLTHLWFLYYLLILYALVLLGRGLIVRLDRRRQVCGAADAIVGRAIRSGTAPVLLAIPVSLALYVRDDLYIWFGIPTPDVSLVPEATSVAAFGTALVFGWLVHRQRHLIDCWRDQWPVHLLAAAGATTMCLRIAGLEPSLIPEPAGVRKLVFAISYGLAIWAWNFAIIGVALRFLSDDNPRVRYVADASYWIYIVHLPVVAAIQVLVSGLPWHWSLKLPMILVASLFVLFLSYHFMVRPTAIGRLLNGRTYPRQLRASPDARLAPAVRMPR
jgi:peptidoglycan/LPS O-acetylase OafA/YrhL